MSVPIAWLSHVRGETIVFGLRSDPEYDGTETLTCDVKVARNGSLVPDESVVASLSVSPVFVPAVGEQAAYWSFTITSTESSALAAGKYVSDAKVVYVDGTVDYPRPIGLDLAERVTA